jgi:hypothetical protein
MESSSGGAKKVILFLLLVVLLFIGLVFANMNGYITLPSWMTKFIPKQYQPAPPSSPPAVSADLLAALNNPEVVTPESLPPDAPPPEAPSEAPPAEGVSAYEAETFTYKYTPGPPVPPEIPSVEQIVVDTDPVEPYTP